MQPNTARYQTTMDKRTWATRPFSKNNNGHIIILFNPGIFDKTRKIANRPAMANENIARSSQYLSIVMFERRFICLFISIQLQKLDRLDWVDLI